MGFFNLFGDSEHRVFNYKPIYYNLEEDERRRKFGSVDGTLERRKRMERMFRARISRALCVMVITRARANT